VQPRHSQRVSADLSTELQHWPVLAGRRRLQRRLLKRRDAEPPVHGRAGATGGGLDRVARRLLRDRQRGRRLVQRQCRADAGRVWRPARRVGRGDQKVRSNGALRRAQHRHVGRCAMRGPQPCPAAALLPVGGAAAVVGAIPERVPRGTRQRQPTLHVSLDARLLLLQRQPISAYDAGRRLLPPGGSGWVLPHDLGHRGESLLRPVGADAPQQRTAAAADGVRERLPQRSQRRAFLLPQSALSRT
jgi:hypothetical protein